MRIFEHKITFFYKKSVFLFGECIALNAKNTTFAPLLAETKTQNVTTVSNVFGHP
ncbi:hypothetical protein GVN20_06835 [Runella sp. CRIBMP]|uniref:hypothetical protein n=1 Tax=Runella sp. CRIBMP TaxID=2683261 RepID=UPI001412CA12|nr:hypothetical protein [Runella sp. CRIBMP]NBB19066.1 hypothetical protein [Runella sp. CRIBMP]